MLAPLLREADRREIQAVYAESAEMVLVRGIAQSERCFTAADGEDRPVALFGVLRAARPGVGVPWMVASNELAAHRRFVIRHARCWLDCLQEGFAELWNCLDARNSEDLRWVRWCGFEVTGTIPDYGVEKRPFVEFRRLAK